MSTPSTSRASDSAASGGLQTVHRALDVLEIAADAQHGIQLATIAERAGLATATAHRLCRTLVDRGYMRQFADRTYAIGPRVIPLAGAANALVGLDARSVLADLVAELGETANMAILAGPQAEYVAQVPARFAMRMFTEVGRRVDLHSTGVGKALLAQLSEHEIDAIVRTSGLRALTPHTICTRVGLDAEVARIRQRGYAMDDQEQELGVRCVAVPVATHALPPMAVSVSGPVTRLTDEVVGRAVPLLRAGADKLAAVLNGGTRP